MNEVTKASPQRAHPTSKTLPRNAQSFLGNARVALLTGATWTMVMASLGSDPLDRWTLRLESTNALASVSYAGGRFYAMGLGFYHDSTNASAWEFHQVPAAFEGASPRQLNAVAHGEGLHVMVGGSVGLSTTGFLLTTPDPASVPWTRLDAGFDTAPILGIHHQDGRFVAVGGSVVTGARILTSTNGATWIDQSLGVQTALRDIAYGAGRWVAVGGLQNGAPTAGILLSSTNAIEWTPHGINPIPGARNGGFLLSGITFGNGRFVATGFGDRQTPFFATSTTGTNWTTQAGEFNGSGWDVVFGDGRFVAGGASLVTSSVDGLNWRRHSPVDLRGNLVFANHTFLGVYPGKVWQSGDVRPRIVSATQPNPGQIQLQLESISDSPLALDQTSDFVHWTLRTQWIASGSTSEINLPGTNAATGQFFRARSP
jgi:hypothetical protein